MLEEVVASDEGALVFTQYAEMGRLLQEHLRQTLGREVLFLHGGTPMAEPEWPRDRETDKGGWTEVSDTYRAPGKATRAVVELHLRWAPGGTGVE